MSTRRPVNLKWRDLLLNLAADITLAGHGNHEIGALDKDSARELFVTDHRPTGL
jgi:hypothetical protein